MFGLNSNLTLLTRTQKTERKVKKKNQPNQTSIFKASTLIVGSLLLLTKQLELI